MRWLARLRMRIEMIFRRGRAAGRLNDELHFHLERQIAENLAAGMSAEEARYSALRAFGNPALLREQARATWSWASLESLLRDLRYGFRTLETHSRVFADRNSGDGVVHRRRHLALHHRALRSAEAAAVSAIPTGS